MTDYPEDFTDVNIKFPSKNLSGVPTAIFSGAFAVYKSNDTTQSTAGLTFTGSFDSVTGLNNINIDLSSDAFYAAGECYQVVATAGTVDSISIVGEVVGQFTIGLSAAYTRLGAPTGASISADIATAQTDLDTITGSDGVNLASTQQAITFQPITITATGTQTNVTLSGSGTGDALGFTRSGSGDLFSTAWISDVDAILDGNASISAILTDTGTTIPATLTSMAGATFNTSTDSLEAIRNRGDAAWVTGAGGSAPTVEQIRTEMDNNSTKLAAILADTDDLQSNQGNWLTATGFATSAALAVVDSNVDAILTDTGTTIPAQISALNNITAADVWTYGSRSLTNVDVNIVKINGVTIIGDGSGTPFDV